VDSGWTSRPEQDFVLDQVADAGENGLVQQRVLAVAVHAANAL
jgi:hypothetical protein